MAGPWERFQAAEQGPWSKFAPVAQPAPEQQSALRQVADVPVGVIKGVVQGVRMIADAFGANSGTSNSIRSVENYLAGLMSAQAKNDQQEIARIMKEAEDKGIADQVAAGLKAFTVAPVDTLSSALGTAAPAIVAALGAKFLGAGALATTAIGALTGAGMGAGVVKGTIYDETKKALLEAGASEQEAERKAILAQEYGGKNLDQILLGTGLGAAAAVGPLEKGAAAILARRISTNVAAREAAEAAPQAAAKGALRRRAEAGLLEAVPEAVQAGQEQVAANIALQREGFDVPTTRGAFSAATLEGLAGLGLGATIGGGRAAEPTPPAPAPAPAAPPPPQGVQDVAGTEPPTTGGGFEISEVPITGEPAAGAGTTPPVGVAGTGENAGRPTGGESAQSAALKKEIAALEEDNAKRKAGIQEDIAKKAAPKRIENRQRKYAEVEAEIEAKKKQLAALPPAPTAPPAPAFSPEELAQIDAELGATPPAAPPAPVVTAPAPAPVVAEPTPVVTAPAPSPSTAIPEGYKPYSEWMEERKRAAEAAPAPAPTPTAPLVKPSKAEIKKDIAEQETLIAREYNKERSGSRFDDASTQTLYEAVSRGTFPEDLTPGSRRYAKVLEDNGIASDVYALPSEFENYTPEQKNEYLSGLAQDVYEELEAIRGKRAELPLWGSKTMTRDARDVYLSYMTENTPEERARARVFLRDYLNRVAAAQGTTRTQTRATTEARIYELNRSRYDKIEGIKFPAWNELSSEQRTLFEESLRKYAPKTEKGEIVTEKTAAPQQDFAFKTLANAIKTEQEAVAAPEVVSPAYEIAQREIEQETKAKEERRKTQRPETPSGRPIAKDAIPLGFVKQAARGNLKPILNYLRERATGGKLRGPQTVIRAVAKRIDDLGLNTKIVVVRPGEIQGNRLAEYDPRTDTIRVTTRGLTEATLLHELVHAATVKTLQKYLSGDVKGLTETQREAVEQILDVMQLSKKTLGRQFKQAFENPYEFVSYAMTDIKFQRELAAVDTTDLEYTVLPSPDSNLWTELVAAFAKLFNATVQKLQARGAKPSVGETNALLETVAAFEQILAVPEGGIDMPALAAQETKQAGAPSEKTDEEFMQELVGEEGKLRLKPRGARAFLQNLFKGTAYEEIVRKFQNERRVVKRIFDRAQRLEIVKYGGPDINDVQGQLTRSTGMAVNIYETNVRPLADEVHSAVEAYAKKLDITVSEALSHIHAILQARHEPERRAVKFLLNVPLDNQKKYTIKGFVDKDGKPLEMSPAAWRQYILEQLSRPDLAPTKEAREAKAKEFRKLLDQIIDQVKTPEKPGEAVKNPAMRGLVKVHQTDPELRQNQIDAIFNKDSELYSVIASRTSQDIARMRRLFDKKEHEKEIDRVVKAVKDLQDMTAELNKKANYWSAPVQNIVDFYGYDNYVPFKGRPGATQLDDETDIGSKRIGGELQELQDPTQGRQSESENPLLQSLSESASAAMRLGRKDLTLAIKNAIKDKILKGKPPTEKNKISFADRYLRGETKKELGGPNKIFHYNEDGTIDILELTDKREVDAIRRGYRISSPMIDKVNAATSFVGQTHTRYNPAFAPMNFVRDSLTNAWLLGAEFGPAMAGKLISAVSAQVANGGPYRAMQFSRLYSAGKFGEINRLAGGNAPYDSLTEEQKYYRDLSDYVKLGGKVSYLQGVAAKGALDTLVKDIGRNQIVKTKEQADRFFDIYNEMFELAARVAVFRVMRGQFLAEGNSAEDAQVRAVTYAKEVANFEQVGQYGKIAGALFMFFRPAATGAVRAIDALRPAFGFDEESFVMEETANGRTPEQIKKAVAKMRVERDNARRMSAMLLGSGMLMYWMAYMMAGDDEEQRNRIATDDMARWTRYARFFIPGMEQPIQIPWGFGPGAFAAAGAQMAALIGSEGRVSMGDAFSNMALIGLDSFLPLPFSRISPIDNFPAFAIDSALPSIARPFVEYVMNLDGLGREIYNNRQSRYGDAYTGGDNIPEVYKDTARWMFNNLGLGQIDVSPNVLYFFANNYFDGFAKFLSTGYNVGLTLSGDKEFDLKQDSLLAASFVGTKSNVDAREFSKAENQIKEIAKRLNALESTSPERYAEYIAKNPENYALVEYYNSQVNGTLRDLRAMANMIRASSDLTPKERKVQIDMIVNLQNMVKRQILLGAESISGRKL